MAIQMRRGLRQDFDPTQMVAGEWAVSVDSSTSNQIVWMCFGAGVVKRMGTYEDFQAMIEEITDDIREDMETILSEVQTLADAVGDDKDAVATMKTAIEQTDMPAIQNYVTTCQTSAQNASLSASNASDSATRANTKATEAQSWAVGGTGTRQGEDTNNAKYWSERAQSTSLAQSDWTENDDTDPSYIAHKPFKTIGTGLSVDNNGALNADGVSSYNDLSNKPQINGNTLTGNKSNADLGIPTKTSDLNNDSGFITDIPLATANTAGKVKPDGTTVTVDQNGVLTAVGSGMDWESESLLGAVNMLQISAPSKTHNGITFTISDDGKVTANGTATADVWFCLYTATGDEPFVGKQVKLRGCPSGGSNNTYSLFAFRAETVGGTGGDKRDIGEGVLVNWLNDGSGNKAQIYINIGNGQTISNLVFEPMITVPTYNGNYAPYAKTNQEITERGNKGLYDYVNELGAKNYLKNVAQTRTQDGITFTVNSDGSIVVNGTATANTQIGIAHGLGLNPNNTYILSGCPIRNNSVLNYALMYFGDGTTVSDVGDGEIKITPLANDHVNLWIKEGYTADDLTFYPMIRLASIEDDTYVPYAMSNTNLTQQLTADNGQEFKYGYDSTSQKYGYYVAGSGGADTFIPFSSGGGALNFTMTRAVTSSNLGGAPVTIDNSDGQYTSMTIVITTSGNPSVVGLQAPTGRYTTVGTYTADISTYASLEFQILRYSGSVSGTINFACTITLE